MVVAPAPRRSTVLDRPDGLEIVVPAKRNAFIMLFLFAWLGGWAFGEFSALSGLLRGTDGPVPFLLFWLIGWTAGGGFAAFVFFWMLAGRERIVLRPRVLAIRREIFGLGRTREYDLAHVKNLRVSPAVYDPFGWTGAARFWGVGGGLVTFDYGAKAIRLAASIDEPEAAQVVQEMRARHAFAQ
jgi:hypothetical protein